jgi:N-methylhydantoinase A
VNKNIDFLRYRIGVPMIAVETLGAGGGSIGWIDEMGLLQMGPISAGSTPGPACYGQGGTRPTVSDANLVLGYLNPEGLVGGRLPLDRAKAEDAIRREVAEPLGLTVDRAAYGMFTIVTNNMVNGIRRVSVEKGEDPRDFALVCAGGATAAHITALAREMGIATVLIPKLASGLCAFGQIISDVKHNYMAPFPARMDAEGVAERLAATFADLEAKGAAELGEDGFGADRVRIRRTLDMRYVGQVHECTVEIPVGPIDAEALPAIRAAFDRRHRELYTYDEPHSIVEIVNVESVMEGVIDPPPPTRIAPGSGAEGARKGERAMMFSADAERRPTPIYDGARLGAGDRVEGPAVIEEETTTIVVEPGWTATLHETGVYLLKPAG